LATGSIKWALNPRRFPPPRSPVTAGENRCRPQAACNQNTDGDVIGNVHDIASTARTFSAELGWDAIFARHQRITITLRRPAAPLGGSSQFVFQDLNINASARTTGRQLAVNHDCRNGSNAEIQLAKSPARCCSKSHRICQIRPSTKPIAIATEISKTIKSTKVIGMFFSG
jgi:hypothetical protein